MVKAIKVILIIVAVVMALAIILVGTGIYFTNRYLQTAAFKEQALRAAHNELGADVRIDDLKVSLFSGVELRGVTIGNPPGFPGNLVTANAFVLRYRLLPLLSRRVEIEELSLDKPVITLSQNAGGEWNYENIRHPGRTKPKQMLRQRRPQHLRRRKRKDPSPSTLCFPSSPSRKAPCPW